jgi:hypothetical protein
LDASIFDYLFGITFGFAVLCFSMVFKGRREECGARGEQAGVNEERSGWLLGGLSYKNFDHRAFKAAFAVSYDN